MFPPYFPQWRKQAKCFWFCSLGLDVFWIFSGFSLLYNFWWVSSNLVVVHGPPVEWSCRRQLDCTLTCHRGLRVVVTALEASAPMLTRQGNNDQNGIPMWCGTTRPLTLHKVGFTIGVGSGQSQMLERHRCDESKSPGVCVCFAGVPKACPASGRSNRIGTVQWPGQFSVPIARMAKRSHCSAMILIQLFKKLF